MFYILTVCVLLSLSAPPNLLGFHSRTPSWGICGPGCTFWLCFTQSKGFRDWMLLPSSPFLCLVFSFLKIPRKSRATFLDKQKYSFSPECRSKFRLNRSIWGEDFSSRRIFRDFKRTWTWSQQKFFSFVFWLLYFLQYLILLPPPTLEVGRRLTGCHHLAVRWVKVEDSTW